MILLENLIKFKFIIEELRATNSQLIFLDGPWICCLYCLSGEPIRNMSWPFFALSSSIIYYNNLKVQFKQSFLYVEAKIIES